MFFKIHPARQDTKSKSQQIPLGSCGYPWGQPLGSHWSMLKDNLYWAFDSYSRGGVGDCRLYYGLNQALQFICL